MEPTAPKNAMPRYDYQSVGGTLSTPNHVYFAIIDRRLCGTIARCDHRDQAALIVDALNHVCELEERAAELRRACRSSRVST